MKTKLLVTIVFVCLVATPALYAQSEQHAMNVPFEFRIGSNLMPPGHYIIQHESNPSLLTLTNRETHKKVNVLVRNVSVTPSAQTKLEFSPTGSPRVLHRITIAGEGHYHDVIHPPDPNDVQ